MKNKKLGRARKRVVFEPKEIRDRIAELKRIIVAGQEAQEQIGIYAKLLKSVEDFDLLKKGKNKSKAKPLNDDDLIPEDDDF